MSAMRTRARLRSATPPDEMKHEAENYGWEEVNGRLLCSKCLEECCDYNPQTYEFTEKTRSSDQVLPQF